MNNIMVITDNNEDDKEADDNSNNNNSQMNQYILRVSCSFLARYQCCVYVYYFISIYII